MINRLFLVSQVALVWLTMPLGASLAATLSNAPANSTWAELPVANGGLVRFYHSGAGVMLVDGSDLISLPTLYVVFNNRPNGHTPTYEGWDEVAGDRKTAGGAASLTIKGMYNGIFISHVAVVATNTVRVYFRTAGILPSPFFQSAGCGMQIVRRPKESLPFRAETYAGRMAGGDLSKLFAPVSDLKWLEVTRGRKLIRFEFPPGSAMGLGPYGNPETSNYSVVASLGLTKIWIGATFAFQITLTPAVEPPASLATNRVSLSP